MEDSKAAASSEPEARPELAHRLIEIARKHPVLAVLGVAGVGLFGGLELATGMLLGVGVSMLVRRQNGHSSASAARGFRERARAVVLAARGKITATEQNGHAPERDSAAPNSSHTS